MDFSQALAALKNGDKVRRSGWNGSGMFVVLQPGYPGGIPANANTAAAFGVDEGVAVVVRPYVAMWTADGQIVPWAATQSDILVDDWEVLAENPQAAMVSAYRKAAGA